MKAFSRLYDELDRSTSTRTKVDALVRYFGQAQPNDAAWAVYFLAGGRPRLSVPSKLLRATARAASGLPDWLFEESYQAVGDFAETVAHVLPLAEHESDLGLSVWIEERLLPLREMEPEAVARRLESYWNELDASGRFLLMKLIGGGFRVGVSRLLVTRALAQLSGVDAKIVAQRMMGYTDMTHRPDAARYLGLLASTQSDEVGGQELSGQPKPFFLAHPLQIPFVDFERVLGAPSDWLIEWKYDGIRGQLVKRDESWWLWSRGEELITERFPEFAALAAALPAQCIVDGEVVVFRDGRVAPFALLQTRIGRKNVSAKVLEAAPAILIAYDLLELDGRDLRALPLHERRALLETVVARSNTPRMQISAAVSESSWEALAQVRSQSRARGVEGFMLKKLDSRYGVGRTKDEGLWWKWKIDPLTIDAVLIYAQRGHGRRASLYTDYTFAVWDGAPGGKERALVPFAKAYSGLTDAEMRKVDAVIRRTTIEKFGPVRSVTPTLVFELGFEGIARSSRHKSGVAVRFPRMLRWRLDKPIDEADTLANLNALIDEADRLQGGDAMGLGQPVSGQEHDDV